MINLAQGTIKTEFVLGCCFWLELTNLSKHHTKHLGSGDEQLTQNHCTLWYFTSHSFTRQTLLQLEQHLHSLPFSIVYLQHSTSLNRTHLCWGLLNAVLPIWIAYGYKLPSRLTSIFHKFCSLNNEYTLRFLVSVHGSYSLTSSKYLATTFSTC